MISKQLYVRRLGMLLASALSREWSLLSSRPTSRAHDRSLCQGDPTRRTKLTNHSPRIHCHCLTQSPAHPASTHSLTQHPSTDRESIYLPRIQNSGAKVWRVIFFNLQGIRGVQISRIKNSPVGPGHFTSLDRYLIYPLLAGNESRLDIMR